MVYINLRLNVADYDKWRTGFDANESKRKSAGSTGVNQFYRDVGNPNNVTLVLEWDEADKAQAFLNDPRMLEASRTITLDGDTLHYRQEMHTTAVPGPAHHVEAKLGRRFPNST